jgi:NADPH2:quinone reductase
VRNFKAGDRVAYVSSQPGAYAQERVVPVNRLVAIPEGVSDRLAAASMLKGLTAQFLLRQTHRVRKGDAVVILAAAGGVGSIAVQWARHLGATVIAIVGSEAKAELVTRLGAQHVLLQHEPAWPARVRELTDGKGADVVYDSVGRETFEASLDCLRPRGLMVSFGNASGPVPPADRARAVAAGLSVSDSTDAVPLHRDPRRARTRRARALRCDRTRSGADRDRPDVPAAGRSAGPP